MAWTLDALAEVVWLRANDPVIRERIATEAEDAEREQMLTAWARQSGAGR